VLNHFFHDERIANDQAHDLGLVFAILFLEDAAVAEFRALFVAFANSAMSGCPTAVLTDCTTDSNGFEEMTLNRSTSTFITM